MTRSRHLVLLLAALLLAAPGPAVAGTYFNPGNEGAVVDLLRPYTDEDLSLEGRALASLAVGPLCEIRLNFDGGAEAAMVVLHPKHGLEGMVFAWTPARPRGLGDALEALIQGNAPEDFFRNVCQHKTDPVKGDEVRGTSFAPLQSAAEGVPPDPGAGADLPVLLWLRILLWVSLSALGLALLGRRQPGVEPSAPLPGVRTEPAWIKVVFIAGLGVRALAMVFEPSHFFELEHVPPGTFGEQLAFVVSQASFFAVDGLTVTGKVFHTPTLQLLLYPWHSLGDLLEVGGTLLWMRLPNLVLSGWMMVLLLRAGRHLGQVGAGRAALVLFAFLPQTVDICLQMGHYLPEAVLSAWFLERLLAATVQRREVWRRVAFAGAAALWSGYVTWPLVAIGVVGGVIHLWRRARRRDMLAFVLAVSALATPLIGTALDAGAIYDEACIPQGELAVLDGVVPVYKDHPIFDVSEPSAAGVLLAPWRVAWVLFDPVTAVFAIAGLLVLLLRRPGEARIPALILLFYGYARTRMTLTLDQLRILVPLMLFLPAWGFALLPELRIPRLPALTGRRVLVGFTAVALIGGSVAHLRQPESGRDVAQIGFYRSLVERVGGANVWGIRQVLNGEQARHLPVVSLAELRLRQVSCCFGFPTHVEMRRCLESESREGFPPEVVVAGDGTRDVLELPKIGCEELRQLLGAPAWRGDAFFLLLPASLQPEGWPECLETIDVRCEVEIRTPLLWLLRCDGSTS
ncbi:MAG: hypothetical protein ABIK09_20895 [Pseudomonadota bacterium]